MILVAALVVALLGVLAFLIVAPARRAAADAAFEAAADAEAAAAAAALPTGGSVFGRVRRPDGVAVAAAALTILGEDGREIARTRADAAGDYCVEVPVPGRYLVVASHIWHDPRATEVRVNDTPVGLELILPGRRPAAGSRPIPAPTSTGVRVPAPASERRA